jgi:type I restriction enzyme, S subunit
MNQDRSTTITNPQIKEGYKQTEIGVIPEDWECVELDQLNPFITSGSRGWADFYSEYGDPFVRITNMFRESISLDLQDLRYVNLPIGANEGKRTQLYDGDFLISITADIGIISYVDNRIQKPAYINQHIALVRFDKEKVNSQFISYFLSHESSQKWFRGGTDQGAKAGMSLITVRKIKTAIPPLQEQEAIACTLSDIDALIESLDQLLTKKRQIKQGTMQELLTGKKRLSTFKNKWEEKYLGDVAEIVMGQSPKSSCYNTKGQGLPLIQGNADILNRQTIKRIFTTEITKRGKYGDIIMSVRAPVGEIARAVFESCIGRGVCAIRYDNDFLYHYLIWRESDWVGLSKGSTFDSVNSADIRSFKLFIPNEPQEQIEIANILSDMDAEIGSIESKLSKTRQLKQGMMHELLTGRIRLVD